MWADAKEQIELELESLRRLIDDHRELLDRIAGREPEPWERSAVAALLHSFYGGVENCLTRIAREVDEVRPSGPDSHAALLASMARPAERRGAVLPAELADRLKTYLRFRHFFRHAYTFELDWRKMEPLVEGLAPIAADFEASMRESLKRESSPD